MTTDKSRLGKLEKIFFIVGIKAS